MGRLRREATRRTVRRPGRGAGGRLGNAGARRHRAAEPVGRQMRGREVTGDLATGSDGRRTDMEPKGKKDIF